MKKVLALVLVFCMAAAFCVTAEAAPAEGKTVKLGLSVPVLSNPFWRAFADQAQFVADQYGVDLTIVDANENDTTQLDQIAGLISAGVDGIVAVPNTTAIFDSILSTCNDGGVKLMIAERFPGITPEEAEGESYIGFIGFDNVAAGYNIAEAIYNAGARKICAIGGKVGGAVADERSEGLHKFLDEHPDMELLTELRNGELREYGLQDAENFLSAYPDTLEGIWCYNDDTAMGAVQALTNAGVNGKVLVGGMDLIDEAVEAIIAGDMVYSTGGQWAESAHAITMLYDALNGFDPDPANLHITIPGVTKENVDLYKAQFIDSKPEYDVNVYSKTLNPEAKTDDFNLTLVG